MRGTLRGTLREVDVSRDNPRIRIRVNDTETVFMYADHPSSDDIRSYMHRTVSLVLDPGSNVRDFYSEMDKSYHIRALADNAGVFDSTRYDNGRRKKIEALHERLERIGAYKRKDPVQLFRSYPYLVMRCPSDERPFGLNAASQIAASLGLPANMRCRGELEYDIVRKGDKGDSGDFASGGGHTCYPSERYFQPLIVRYGFDVVQREVAFLVANGRLVYDEERKIVASPKAVRFRDAIVKHLSAHSSSSDTDVEMEDAHDDSDDDATPRLSQAQKEAVERAKHAAVTVVIGPAGTGKTRVVQEIKRQMESSAWLCAPTGKAARRMGADARTIHSFMGTFDTRRKKDGEDDREDAETLEPDDLLVVDEASMLDFSIAYTVFRLAADKQLRLMFVGDPFQLPSVEWGTVMDDLIEWARASGCLVELSSVFRQGEESGLLKVATAVRAGDKLSMHSLPDVQYISFDREEDMVEDVARRWKACQIITPTNKVRDAINFEVLGRRGVQGGDKVICLRNQDSGGAKNGDIGYLITVHTISFPVEGNPNRKRRQRVAVFKTEDDGRELQALAKDITHAYAITVHKAQGSEWDGVCLAIKGVGGSFINKKLLYTALTRAKKRVTIASVGKAFFRGTHLDAPHRHSLGL
eukprot:jgi/Tetstr1/463975/TSEL_008780.t1